MTTPERLTNPEVEKGMLESEPPDIRRMDPRDFLRTKEQVEAYAVWKREIPQHVRTLVEGSMMGQNVRVDGSMLPLMQETLETVKLLLANPSALLEDVAIDPRVKNMLAPLQRLKIKKEEDEVVNLYEVLARPNVSFDAKLGYTRDRLLPRLGWLTTQARKERDTKATQESEITISPDEEHDSYEVRRGPEGEKTEGMPEHVTAMIYPYFGGHYASVVYNTYDSTTCRWSRSTRRYRELPNQTLDEDATRIYRGAVRGGKTVAIGRSDNWQRGPWSVDKDSIRWRGDEPTSWTIARDQDAVIVLSVEGEPDTTYQFDVDIGPCEQAIVPDPPEGEPEKVSELFHAELCEHVERIMQENISAVQKIKRITSFIRKHLEYSLDASLEAVYKADTAHYFTKIWELKQAKCDEANTLAARVLQKYGFHTRFVGEHSARTKSDEGWTLLHDGNLHGWFWAYDPDDKEWLRLDATPKGDPNVDEEEQDAELGEGDFGEQEAKLMSEEELQTILKELEQKEKEQEERERPEIAFAREANCSPEEAKKVLEKIKELREKYARVLKDAQKQWHGLVRKNMRERIVDRGPVPLSQADDIDDDELVSGFIEYKAGETDPHIGTKDTPKKKKEEWFGGYEVYIAADMSDSMNEEINGVAKKETQRDMVFLTIDSCMSAAVHARKKNARLKSPMPVNVCLTVFGKKTEVVLPVTDIWGPAEQIRVYRALDAAAGGGTPDDAALAMIETQIADARQQEDDLMKKSPARKRAGMKKHDWRMRRFVVVVADGGSNNRVAVKSRVDALSAQDIPVDLVFIGSEDDTNLQTAAQATYGSVIPIPDPNDLAVKCLSRLTQRIHHTYGK